MFKWPRFKLVDMNTYARRDLYEHFLSFEIPVATRTIQLDVTRLWPYIRVNKYKFSLFFGFIIMRAANHVQEFRLRIHDEDLVEYDHVIPSFTVLSDDKRLFFSKGVFSDNFIQDYAENSDINKNAALGREPNMNVLNHGQVFISVNPWNRFTGLQFPYSRRYASMPTISIGMIYKDGDLLRVPFAIQTHHGLVDGFHMGQFIKIIEDHLQDPEKVFKSISLDT